MLSLALWSLSACCISLAQNYLQETPVKLELSPEAFDKAITLEGLLTHARKLYEFANIRNPEDDEGVTRSFASPGYNASADYFAKLVNVKHSTMPKLLIAHHRLQITATQSSDIQRRGPNPHSEIAVSRSTESR
jgi:hypothetical protein